MTEHDKYAKGATKPGGFAAQGFYGSSESAKAEAPAGPSSLEFLATRPPWKCSVCNVTCTSNETLMGHAAGAKHKRRVSLCLLFLDDCHSHHALMNNVSQCLPHLTIKASTESGCSRQELL